MRGEAFKVEFESPEDRITPACAGRSDSGVLGDAIEVDHPRVCGEKCPTTGWSPSSSGSPPRVRGEAPVPLNFESGGRITPACAGRRLKRSPI